MKHYKFYIRPYFFKVLLGLCGFFPLLAQDELGKPFLHNYPRKEYNAASQNWAIVQNSKGILYVGNDDGLLEFDGTTWRLIEIPNHSAVRSLAIDKNDRVYVGASSEIGYLAPNEIGKLQYVSLLEKIPAQNRDFADTWATHLTPQGDVFFQADNYIFQFQANGKLKIFYPEANNSFFLSFWVNSKLWVHTLSRGLMLLENENLSLIKKGDFFANKRIYTILPYQENILLIGVKDEGLYLYDLYEQRIEKWETPANELLNQYALYTATKLHDGNYAFGTRKGGVLIVSKRGEVLEKIDESTNLQDNNVRYIFQSQEHTLWLALDEGISRVEISSPIRFWDRHNGLRGRVEHITRFQNTLYVATSSGLFYLKKNRFHLVKDTETQCWSLVIVRIEEKEMLILANNKGIFEIKQDKAILIDNANNETALCLYHSQKVPSRLFVGLKHGLMSLIWENGRWRNEGKIQNVSSHEEVYSLAEDKDGSIWIGTFIHGVIRLQFSQLQPLKVAQVERFNQNHGFASVRDLRIFYIQQEMYFGTKSGLYRFDSQKKLFFQDKTFAKAFTNKSVFSLIQDQHKQIWIAGINNLKSAIGKITQKKGQDSYQFNDTILKRLPEISRPFLFADGDNIWIGSAEGLFKLNSSQSKSYYQKFNTLIRKVIVAPNKTIFEGVFTEISPQKKVVYAERQTYIPQLPFEENSITFFYAAPQFEGENDAMQYSHFLEGYDEKWSEWSEDTKKQYTNLYEGTYTFRVKARNIYLFESKEAVFTFKVLTPWYRTWWAYIIYFVLSIVTVLAIIYWNNQRLITQNENLEKAIQKRTEEILLKNIELEQQREEISLQAETLADAYNEINKQKKELQGIADEIKASINYASRIQNAILPDIQTIKQGIPEIFIIYRPRDVVSGDFYWYTETQAEPLYAIDPVLKASVFKGFSDVKQIIAAIDCTGHGVPGAFMSMIGDSYLNQIVNLQGIVEPDEILRELHFNVSTALRKHKTQNNDGMDVAICTIDKKNKILEYAGARNPLVYIQNNQLYKITADRYAVGGYIFDDMYSRRYTKHTISFEQPTWFYIFSDGYQDQFGQGTLRKFTTKQLYNLFLEIHQYPAETQKQIMEDTLETWMYNSEQVDDILVIGFKLG
ncbi:MAG: SpoIIE family protein phosphatase [Microscillaceae bacterium]|nr:SpoIIE family protein phosphatase [Microscillaceae bacterium]MDW8461140.1 two-component regulator propeller domain-containing protein [Cytophagales bacterium]